MAIAKGAITYYGTYTVNEAEKSISLIIEGTNFPIRWGERKIELSPLSALTNLNT